MSPRDRNAKQQEKAAEQAGEEAAQSTKDRTGVGDKPPSDPEQLREEIRETREELGETVDALSQKADVKGQAQETVAERKEQLREKQEEVKARVAGLGEKVREVTPEQAREAAGQAALGARERPAPTAAIGGFLLGLLVGWTLARR